MASSSGLRAFWSRAGGAAFSSSFGPIIITKANHRFINNVAATSAWSVVAARRGGGGGTMLLASSSCFCCSSSQLSHNLPRAFSSLSSSSSVVMAGGSAASVRGATTPSRLVALNLPPETLGEKAYRWADVSGFFTRWNSRKAWVMYLDPYTRISAIMMTEYERKLRMFININEVIMFSISIWIWWYFMNHFNAHAPPPKLTQDGLNAEHLGAHLNPFSRLPFIQPRNRCYECRWLDLECKRRCFDKLRAEGHKFIIRQHPLSEPRFKLEDPHHHH
eukprot:GHVS01043170.1.p1 GENE.GHVS01043170.1~~GHVS01043170.1.p1  ORF type:complete len:276 (+),score=60.36 GHVS01043170.1:113-940(+)